MIETCLDAPIPGLVCPSELPAALQDGAVLCRVINRLHPGRITAVHEETDRAKVMTSLRVRKNVDNFLDACHRLDIRPDDMCTSLDILQMKNTTTLSLLLETLIMGAGRGTTMAM